MERATQPVGATGLPLDGRATAAISKLAGAAALTVVPASLRAVLSQIMVLNSFERDFQVDLGTILTPDGAACLRLLHPMTASRPILMWISIGSTGINFRQNLGCWPVVE
jgi:hypothetical protein